MNPKGKRPLLSTSCAVLAALVSLIAFMPGMTRAQTRIEMRPVESVTLTAQQFLTGDKNGKPVTLAGELRIPKPGTDRLPALILIHGIGGISPSHERWAQESNSIGVATFTLDSFSGRGLTTLSDRAQLATLTMMVDAYRALGMLAQHPRIDPGRIAVMGFSMGTVAALYSSSERFRKMYGPPNAEFAAHIGLYALCITTYQDDDKVTGKPIRLFHGIADDWNPLEPCRAYVERLKKAGADVTLMEYPDASHSYDMFFLKQPVKLAQAPNPHNCRLEEGGNGQILNSRTGNPFDLNDPCVEKGATIAYNEAATAATTKAVTEFLVATFHLKP